MHYCWQLNASVAWNLGARARELGWCKVESTLPPPMWPRFESWRWHHIMWVEFVVSCSERFFSWYSRFPFSLKNNTSKFQFNLERTDTVSMSSMQLLSVCAPRVTRKKKKKKKRAYKLLRQFLCWIMLAQLLYSCQNKKTDGYYNEQTEVGSDAWHQQSPSVHTYKSSLLFFCLSLLQY